MQFDFLALLLVYCYPPIGCARKWRVSTYASILARTGRVDILFSIAASGHSSFFLSKNLHLWISCRQIIFGNHHSLWLSSVYWSLILITPISFSKHFLILVLDSPRLFLTLLLFWIHGGGLPSSLPLSALASFLPLIFAFHGISSHSLPWSYPRLIVVTYSSIILS